MLGGISIATMEKNPSGDCGPTPTPSQRTPYGRTARNNVLTEALVFHQTLSTPKASYSGLYPSGTPQGRTQKIHIFPQGSNNKNELQYLMHFIHPGFIEIHYYNAKCQSAKY